MVEELPHTLLPLPQPFQDKMRSFDFLSSFPSFSFIHTAYFVGDSNKQELELTLTLVYHP